MDVYLRAVLEYDRFASANGLPRDVTKVKRNHVEAFLEDQDQHHKPATVAARFSGLRRFYAWLVTEDEIAVSPVAKMRPPKVPETLPKVLTDDEVAAPTLAAAWREGQDCVKSA